MDVDIQEARLTFETNIFAVIRICQTFLPLLMKSKGTIVQVGSVAAVSSL
jgi:1-acylglycerone phosphate reductase